MLICVHDLLKILQVVCNVKKLKNTDLDKRVIIRSQRGLHDCWGDAHFYRNTYFLIQCRILVVSVRVITPTTVYDNEADTNAVKRS